MSSRRITTHELDGFIEFISRRNIDNIKEMKSIIEQLNQNVVDSKDMIRQYDSLCLAINGEVEKKLLMEEIKDKLGHQEDRVDLQNNEHDDRVERVTDGEIT